MIKQLPIKSDSQTEKLSGKVAIKEGDLSRIAGKKFKKIEFVSNVVVAKKPVTV